MITLECQKGPLTLEYSEKASFKVLFLQHRSQQEPSPPNHLFMGAIFQGQLEADIVDMQPAPPHFEDEVALAAEQLLEINLSRVGGQQYPTFLGTGLDNIEQCQLIDLLRSCTDCFAWPYDEMPRLQLDIVVHRLAIKPGFSPVKQAECQFRHSIDTFISKEIMKLKEAKFIREVQYPKWITNIVPIKNKNGQLHICVDF